MTDVWNLDAGYSVTVGRDDNKRLLYETPGNTDDYDLLNEDLSSEFKSKSMQHRPYAGITYRSDNLMASFRGGYESTNLKNEERFTNTAFNNTYDNFFSRFFMRYRIDESKSFRIFYNNSRSIPSVHQLQPVANTTDPLNIVVGNPNLKPSLSNRFSVNYNDYNFKSKTGMYIYLGGNYNTDEIVSSTVTDEDLVRTTTYTNVDGRYNLNMYSNYYKEFRMRDKSTLRPNIGASVSYGKDIGFSNGHRYNANSLRLGPTVGVEYDIPDIINISPSYNLSYNNTKYSLDNRGNQSHTDHEVRMEITSYWPKNLIFGNNISYNYIGQTAPGFDNNYILWNMSLGYEIWNGDGTIKVTVFDLLNQNVATRRITGEDYIQDSQQLVLKRYAMFSFTYKISKFGGKKSRQTGRMRRF